MIGFLRKVFLPNDQLVVDIRKIPDADFWNKDDISGSVNIYVRQTDVAGNVSPASSAFAYTLDTTAPSLNSATVSGTSFPEPAATNANKFYRIQVLP